MGHQVFIERCRDSEPETARHLAATLAERYGIDPDQILSRLKKGRFRVKANLAFAEAREFMSYVEAHGALCTIVDGEGQIAVRSMRLSETVRGRPMQPPTPPPENDLGTSDTIRVSEPIDPSDFALTLMTPLPPEEPKEDYVDEAGLSSGSLRLSTLDGATEELETEASASAVRAADANAFLPPEMAAEQDLELDVEPTPPPPVSRQMEAVAASPPVSQAMKAVEPRAATEPARAASVASMPVASVASKPAVPQAPPHQRALGFLERNERARFAVGITLAILVGFLAAHIYASMKEEARYKDAQTELREEYASANTVARWEALDAAREAAVTTLKSRQANIATTSILIWIVVAGLFGLVWIRFVDWSRFALKT